MKKPPKGGDEDAEQRVPLADQLWCRYPVRMFGLSHKQLYLLCAAALVAMVVGFEIIEQRQEAGPQPYQLHSKLPELYSGPREGERAREIFASKRECEDRARNLRAKIDMGVYEWSCKKA